MQELTTEVLNIFRPACVPIKVKSLEWKYIKSRKVWKTIGHYRKLQISESFFNKEGFVLQWNFGKLKLLNRKEEMIQPIHTFSNLEKAKEVAQLIYEG